MKERKRCAAERAARAAGKQEMGTNRNKRLAVPKLGARLQRAFRYAARKHEGQTRKQTAVPYLSHLMAVASLVLEAGGDEDMAIAALLHDVVEDCGGMPRLREIRRQFGARVARIVAGCTDSFVKPKPEWIERKTEYLRQIKHADAETRLVSASDKLHNVRTILADYRKDGEAIWARFNGKKEGTLWYYRALTDEYQRRCRNRITRELAIAVAELERETGRSAVPGAKNRKTNRRLSNARRRGK
jgi:(p)ppGpp synthase/HD superfamily hydrolase